jgi:ATP-dependent RNA helicase DBP3
MFIVSDGRRLFIVGMTSSYLFRTGRAGNKGISHTFFTLHDKARAGELNNLLRQMKQDVPESLMKFGTTVKKKQHDAYGAFFKEIDESVKPTKIVFDSDDDE